MIAPTLACINYQNIEEDIRAMDAASVDSFHIDIMDGHYVPNLCLNFDMLATIRGLSKTPMDAHLMVTNPMDYIDRLAALNIEYACTHADACADVPAFLAALKAHGMKAGLALSPDVPVESLAPYLPLLDYVLMMYVTPGFAGQAFQPQVLEKQRALCALRDAAGLSFEIFADGGIGWNNAAAVMQAGGDRLVAGVFAVFGQPQGLEAACREFRQLAISSKKPNNQEAQAI